MIAAAILEIKRLHLARELELVNKKVVLPMSVFWQVPQHFLLGAAEVFTFIGQHEFFYEHAPDAMRSLFSALSLLTNSLGIGELSELFNSYYCYFLYNKGWEAWMDTK